VIETPETESRWVIDATNDENFSTWPVDAKGARSIN
jgi:hypothetical protein